MPDPLAGRLAAMLTGAPPPGGILLTGPPGIGRTRLLALVAQACSGRAVVLRPDDLPAPSAAPAPRRYAATTRALRRRAVDRPLVLAVDDLHLLPTDTVHLVEHLADAQVARLLATAPSSATCAAPVAPLLRRGTLRREPVPPLTAAGIAAVVTATLGGRADAVTVAELLRYSQGNPGLLRALLAAAPASGTLIRRAGTWRWSGRLPLDAVRDTVTALTGTPPTTAARYLAVAGPVPVPVLERLVDARTLEVLEEHEIIRLEPAGGEAVLRLSQPLYAALLREQLAPTDRSRLLRELAGAATAARADPVRTVDWLVRGGLAVAPGRRVAHARIALARGDADLAHRLAGAGDSVAHADVRAQALLVQGRVTDAEELFARIGAALPPSSRALRIVNLLWGLRRPQEAARVAREAFAAAQPPYPPELELAGEALALFTTVGGGVPVRSAPIRHPLLASTAAAVRGYRMIFTGRPGRIAAEHAADLVWPSMRGSAAACQVHALVLTGRLARAREVAAEYYDMAVTGGEPAEVAPLAMQRGVCEWWAGSPARALPFLREAAALLDDRVPYPVQAYVTSEYAVCLAAVGEGGRALRMLAGARAALPAGGRLRNHLLVGEIRVLALTGELSRAAEAAVRRAAGNLREGRLTSAAEGYYLAARLTGDPDVANRLAAVARRCDGELFELFAAHATALAGADRAGLREVADRFEAGGYSGFALEAVAAAAGLARRDGDDRGTAEGARVAARLTLACDGFRPAWLRFPPGPVRLGARERQACELAAAGLDNRQIAQRMGIAVRTVTNHLARGYAKLGVRGRQELAAALAPVS
ncbi:putative LuxR family transcriptional regulator [Actinoplanes sp. SE50]|uniref:helix-turn-helix transcriptional regulator n=1 Tax=unclassified Actinoplanes TaxID=2626549 RepID=UPI00023ED498|nr:MULTISPECIES: LuxR C-terminal-related transcriptional regulator [unclassified Actinoplanes]AEV86167.1 putative LuxR family transcriptional regulator [Actinoplanes sp. SE50/110]ATO84565.1 putative LuxR family transcriptional regulator [Actinoplanes sp. SE50]SLM01975.1 LuxR family transcriptional regulator [Actinoplanes sp. SE50/110]